MPDDVEFDLSSAMDSIAQEIAAPAPAPEPAPTPASSSEPAPTPSPRAYPKTWKPDHSSLWDTLPDPIKDEALRREDDFHKGIEGYKTKAGMGERLEKLLQPYQEVIRQYNIDPDQILGSLLQAHMKLAMGQPDDRIGVIKTILKDYKITPEQLGFQSGGEPPYVDPALDPLIKRLDTVDSRLQAEEQRRVQEARDKAAQEVQTFRSDPKHDLFDKASTEISALLRSNKELTLHQAYEQAIWMNPETRKIMLERETKAAAVAREADERERARKAAEASAGSVRTNARDARETTVTGTIDDTMRETLKAFKAQH